MARPVPENTDATFGCVFLLCGARDIGALARVRDPHFGMADLYIYDKYSGGTGLSEALYLRIPDVFTAAFETLSASPCKSASPPAPASGFKVRYAVAYRQTPFKCTGMSVVVPAIS